MQLNCGKGLVMIIAKSARRGYLKNHMAYFKKRCLQIKFENFGILYKVCFKYQKYLVITGSIVFLLAFRLVR